MSTDLPAVQSEEKDDQKTLEMPEGNSLIHQRADGPEIFRLACRLRLDMRQDGLSLKEARQVLVMAYPELEEMKLAEVRKFLEDYVDPAVIVEPSFWKKGLMRATASLNTAVEMSNIAQRMQDKWEEMEEKVEQPEQLDKWISAGKKVAEVRAKQALEMERVGFGPQKAKDHAAPMKQAMPSVQVNAKDVTFHLNEAMGGSFSRKPIDVKAKPATDTKAKPAS